MNADERVPIGAKLFIIFGVSTTSAVIGYCIEGLIEPMVMRAPFDRCHFDVMESWRAFSGWGPAPFAWIANTFWAWVFGFVLGFSLVSPRQLSFKIIGTAGILLLAYAIWQGQAVKWIWLPCRGDQYDMLAAQEAFITGTIPFLCGIVGVVSAVIFWFKYRREQDW